MSAQSAALRSQVRDWLAEHWNARDRRPAAPGERQDWLRLVFEAGWAGPDWPTTWWGRGLDRDETAIVVEEFGRVGAPGAARSLSSIGAHTAMRFGSDELKLAAIPRILIHESRQCLLYSEPAAGSDLASLRTRAERHGDRYVVNGQKVWTSAAHLAEYGLLIARTDWDVPKHQGLSFFMIEMDQPGIEIRPIHQITGDSHFNQVFLDDVQVPVSHRLGEEGQGWQVLQSALAVERAIMGTGVPSQGGTGASLDLIALARETGRIDDPLARQQIAQAIAWRELNALNMARGKAEVAQGSAAPVLSLGKLAMSRILHNEARVARMLLGAAALLDGPDDPRAADANYRAANAYMTSIGGGTDQIQRNIIGERLLGLPREEDADRGRPFGQARAAQGGERHDR